MDVENATRNTNNTHYGTNVLISCETGYQFPDRDREKTIGCTVNETWTDYPDPCEGNVCTRSLCVQLVQSAELVMKVTHCNRQTLAFVFQETLSPTCFIQYIALVYPDNLHKIIWQKNNF